MNLDNVLNAVTGAVNGLIALGLSLVTAALVVDVLFGSTTNIVANLSGLISQFTSQGLIGLLALVAFVAIANRS